MAVNINGSVFCNFLLGFKCPVCSKSVASNEMEVHFIMCLSKPRLSYNGKRFPALVTFLFHDCMSSTWD